MAIIYTRGQKTQYTGFDKVQHAFGSAIEAIKSAPRRVLDGIEARSKAEDEKKRMKNRQLIERTFGSVENYNKFNNGAK